MACTRIARGGPRGADSSAIFYNCLKSLSPRGDGCMARRSHRLHGQGGSIEPEGAMPGSVPTCLEPGSESPAVRAAVFDAGYRILISNYRISRRTGSRVPRYTWYLHVLRTKFIFNLVPTKLVLLNLVVCRQYGRRYHCTTKYVPNFRLKSFVLPWLLNLVGRSTCTFR